MSHHILVAALRRLVLSLSGCCGPYAVALVPHVAARNPELAIQAAVDCATCATTELWRATR